MNFTFVGRTPSKSIGTEVKQQRSPSQKTDGLKPVSDSEFAICSAMAVLGGFSSFVFLQCLVLN